MLSLADELASHSGKISQIKADFKIVIDDFPGESSLNKFSSAAESIGGIMVGYDKDTRKEMTETISILTPCFNDLFAAVKKYYREVVAPVLIQLEADMDFDKVSAVEPLRGLCRVCDVLPAFDHAHQLSGGLLLPEVYQNFRRIAKDLNGLLVVAPKVKEAIDDEYFNLEMAGKCLACSTELHADKFRGAFGDIVNWASLIDKFGSHDVVVESKAMMVKHTQPLIVNLGVAVTSILTITDLKNLTTEKNGELQALASDGLDKDLDAVEAFAITAGDTSLRAQLGQFRCLLHLVRSLTRAAACKIGTSLKMSDENIAIVSNLRIALRGATKVRTFLPKLFCTNAAQVHVVTDFDKEDYGTGIGAFVDGATEFLDILMSEWQALIKKLSDNIVSWIPEYKQTNMFDEPNKTNLLTNVNFGDLGAASNELFALLELHKKIMKDRCVDFIPDDMLQAALKAKDSGVACDGPTVAPRNDSPKGSQK